MPSDGRAIARQKPGDTIPLCTQTPRTHRGHTPSRSRPPEELREVVSTAVARHVFQRDSLIQGAKRAPRQLQHRRSAIRLRPTRRRQTRSAVPVTSLADSPHPTRHDQHILNPGWLHAQRESVLHRVRTVPRRADGRHECHRQLSEMRPHSDDRRAGSAEYPTCSGDDTTGTRNHTSLR